jgi:SAM-dependent methyltransferase
MATTRSGDYRLPGTLYQLVGNMALRGASLAPVSVGRRFIAGRSGSYQAIGEAADADSQGPSDKKWEALQMPDSLKGRSVLDIGCSEGYFAHACARLGADFVLGIDGNLGRLLTATFRASQEGLSVRYRMGVFPALGVHRRFDYVLCLSVLHHALRCKDVWKVLTSPDCRDDKQSLRGQLERLRNLTATAGRCIVEVPYEYEDPVAERKVVDFALFGEELRNAGFARARCIGTWEYNPRHVQFKDRIIYVAEA